MPLIPNLELPLAPLRKKTAAKLRDEDMLLTEVGDSLQGDEFRRTRHPYESIKLVSPVFTENLSRQIDEQIARYELQNGHRIPPAYRFPRLENQERWGTNKAARLDSILWISRQLETPANQQEAINQLACIIERVEKVAQKRFKEVSHLYLPDPLPIRLPEPLPETVHTRGGKLRILVSYATRHVTIFREDGAMQVQCLGERPEKLAYAERAKIPGLVLVTKPGTSGFDFWTP